MPRSTARCESVLKKHGLNSTKVLIQAAKLSWWNCPWAVPSLVLPRLWKGKSAVVVATNKICLSQQRPALPGVKIITMMMIIIIIIVIFLFPRLVICPERAAQLRESSGTWLCTLCVKSGLWEELGNEMPWKPQESQFSRKWPFSPSSC